MLYLYISTGKSDPMTLSLNSRDISIALGAARVELLILLSEYSNGS